MLLKSPVYNYSLSSKKKLIILIGYLRAIMSTDIAAVISTISYCLFGLKSVERALSL